MVLSAPMRRLLAHPDVDNSLHAFLLHDRRLDSRMNSAPAPACCRDMFTSTALQAHASHMASSCSSSITRRNVPVVPSCR